MMNDNLQIADGIPAGISAGSFLNTKAELRFSYFDIRNSAFDIHPIRRALIEADLVETAPRECASLKSEGTPQVVSEARDNMVALPGQLFTNTQIPACIWFLKKNTAKRSRPGAAALRDRHGETLFIDARKLGFMKDRVLRDFTADDVEKIAGTFRAWRIRSDDTPVVSKGKKGDRSGAPPYQDLPGFCKSATLQQISSHGHVLTPGRYVGAEDIEDDGEGFDNKMARLSAELANQFAENSKLESAIKANLKGLGYAL